MMSDKLEWTKNLGDAVLAQQPDVMDAVQRLRTKAYDNKKLVTTKQQKVSVQTQESKQVDRDRAGRPRDGLRAVLRSGHGLRRPGPMRTIRHITSATRPISARG